MHGALRDEGVHVGRKRVARIMRDLGLVGRCRRRWVRTTISDPDVAAVDLLKRAFGPGTVDLDRVYVGDITYIRTWEGWLYLATVIDLASRRVVGWAMADHMRAELVCDAVGMAIENRRPAPGAMFHSDRGTQYTSKEFTDLLAEHEMIQSLSVRGSAGQRGRGELLRATEARVHLPSGAPDPRYVRRAVFARHVFTVGLVTRQRTESVHRGRRLWRPKRTPFASQSSSPDPSTGTRSSRPEGRTSMKGYVAQKGNRWYAVIYEGLDPVTGQEKRSWHVAGNTRLGCGTARSPPCP